VAFGSIKSQLKRLLLQLVMT